MPVKKDSLWLTGPNFIISLAALIWGWWWWGRGQLWFLPAETNLIKELPELHFDQWDRPAHPTGAVSSFASLLTHQSGST